MLEMVVTHPIIAGVGGYAPKSTVSTRLSASAASI